LNIFNFISLREFHFLEIDFHINDLLKILNNCSGMKSISFTLTQNHLTSIWPPPNGSYDIFKNLESINVVFHVNPANTFFVDLIEYCLNLKWLEMNWSPIKCNKSVSKFSYTNKFIHLKRLLLRGWIQLELNKKNINLLSRLEYFNVNFDFDYSIQSADSNFFSLVQIAKRINIYGIDLNILSFIGTNNLVELDLRSIHVHESQPTNKYGIGNELAELKCKFTQHLLCVFFILIF
jgi:hypothetical protein